MSDQYSEFLSKMKVPPPPRKKWKRGTPRGLMAEHCNQWIREHPGLSYREMMPFKEFIANYCGWHFARQFMDTGQGKWYIRPSGQKCVREEAFKKVGPIIPISPEVRGRFFKGDLIEAYTICIGLMAGRKIHSFQKEVKIPMVPHPRRPHHYTKGHLDFLIDVGRPKRVYIMDVKGPSDIKWIKETEDPWGYKKQLRTYMMSTELRKIVHGGALVYCGSNAFNEWKEVMVPAPTTERKEQWYEFCNTLTKVKTEDHIPDRPDWATTRIMKARKPEPKTLEVMEAIQCKLCSYRERCWGSEWYERPSGNKTDVVRDV